MSANRVVIGVIGGGAQVAQSVYDTAIEVGRLIARNEAFLVCGGLGGVMEAASKGASENNGTVIGILPGDTVDEANPYLTVRIPSGMGVGRNVLVVRAADVLIAFPGSYGTLSEIALALHMGKGVVYMPGTWPLHKIARIESSLFKEAIDPIHAVGLALDMAGSPF